jgi:hypothetical protein
MARRTIAALLAEATTNLPDNSTGLISPADIRDIVKNIADTFSPGYAAVSRGSLVLPALGLTPQVVTYDTNLIGTPDYAVDLVTGAITRLAGALNPTFNRVSFYTGVSAPNGNEVVFRLYRDGIAIPGGVELSAQGNANIVAASFSLPSATSDGLDHAYDVRATKVSGGADNVTLTNARFILEYIPTIGV